MTTAVPSNHEEQADSEQNAHESIEEERNNNSVLEIVKTFANTAFTTALIVAGLLIVAIWILPVAFGAKPITVLSGSMEPTISAGDVIWVDTDKSNVGLGTIVVYHPEAYDETLVTHRVISVNTGLEKTYITQGDANGKADEPIVEGQIVGVVKSPLSFVGFDNGFMSFPKAGYLQQHLFEIGVVIVGLCVVYWIISSVRTKLKAKKEALNG